VAGVSEGAALAILAAARVNHSWVSGVMTLGLPASAELAWRWKDALSWITKQDSAEPSFEPAQLHRRGVAGPSLDDPVDEGRIRDPQ